MQGDTSKTLAPCRETGNVSKLKSVGFAPFAHGNAEPLAEKPLEVVRVVESSLLAA